MERKVTVERITFLLVMGQSFLDVNRSSWEDGIEEE